MGIMLALAALLFIVGSAERAFLGGATFNADEERWFVEDLVSTLGRLLVSLMIVGPGFPFFVPKFEAPMRQDVLQQCLLHTYRDSLQLFCHHNRSNTVVR